mmetsp:Transcript_58247/g.62938  ORF Transcript_58247/g.62938 Transcript_58247/m.62938 type:complete len:94 (-) Transcript_58247:834-1115(-)
MSNLFSGTLTMTENPFPTLSSFLFEATTGSSYSGTFQSFLQPSRPANDDDHPMTDQSDGHAYTQRPSATSYFASYPEGALRVTERCLQYTPRT